MAAITDMVDLEIQDGVAMVRIDNPSVNALSRGVRDGLFDAVKQADADDAVKAILIICNGRTYIAGADIKEFGKPQEGTSQFDVQTTIESNFPVDQTSISYQQTGMTPLDLAGHQVPADMQGRSFKNLLLNRNEGNWRSSFYYRYYESHFNTPRHFGIRTETHKLIRFDGINEWELYDLEKDPVEVNNLASDPNHQSIMATLRLQLNELQMHAGDHSDDIGALPRTGNPILDAEIERRARR